MASKIDGYIEVIFAFVVIGPRERNSLNKKYTTNHKCTDFNGALVKEIINDEIQY